VVLACWEVAWEERPVLVGGGRTPAIRFKVPESQVYVVHDLARGQVIFESDNARDFIIMKSDGIRTYNLRW